jgi:hypothetical protein
MPLLLRCVWRPDQTQHVLKVRMICNRFVVMAPHTLFPPEDQRTTMDGRLAGTFGGLPALAATRIKNLGEWQKHSGKRSPCSYLSFAGRSYNNLTIGSPCFPLCACC